MKLCNLDSFCRADCLQSCVVLGMENFIPALPKANVMVVDCINDVAHASFTFDFVLSAAVEQRPSLRPLATVH